MTLILKSKHQPIKVHVAMVIPNGALLVSLSPEDPNYEGWRICHVVAPQDVKGDCSHLKEGDSGVLIPTSSRQYTLSYIPGYMSWNFPMDCEFRPDSLRQKHGVVSSGPPLVLKSKLQLKPKLVLRSKQ